ncbi:tetratricopeptide repeat protein 7B-like [Saccostrea echinata]|uniref:tetratricopeptide repeat protein 7B-like n=1 Tax=Saccostrea echinata TaxID=191078 RepID=UPI002A82065F|nr:tetratricopeptide repeat protein 7B-like [Saccostrea echinata]
MAAKAKFNRLESEIERCRAERSWLKALEAAKQLANKYQQLDFYVTFTHAESTLEHYVKDNIPLEKNHNKACDQLTDVEKTLSSIASSGNKLSFEAKLLLAKLYYCKGSYDETLRLYDEINLDSVLDQNMAPRVLQLLAEAYSIKGSCLESKGPSTTSKYKAAEQEKLVLQCFETAGDLALLYVQEREKMAQSNSSGEEEVDIILENAIKQSPLMYIKRGDIKQGVGRFRELLRVVESRFTQSLRQALARQLAEVLIRGMCEKTYIPIEVSHSSSSQITHPLPRKYSGENLFIPRELNEEALLLLLVAEAIVTREAVLNQSEEHREDRHISYENTTAVYDLLAITLVRCTQFLKLSDSFEKAMRFSFEEFHIWHQFANTLICSGKYSRALHVLKECSRLKPKNTVVLLQAAKLCFECLHLYNDGINLVQQAIDSCSESHPLLSRLYVALGIGYSLKAQGTKLQGDRYGLHKKALDAFKYANELDQNDYLALFHLALQLALQRQISEAIRCVKMSLKHKNDYMHSLHLLVLLMTSEKKYEEGMTLIQAALQEYPDNLSLMLTRSKLEEVLLGPEYALDTCREMLELWKELYETDVEDTSSEKKYRTITSNDRSTFDRRSFAQLQLNELNDRDTGSVRAESVAASRVEQTLSEVASSMGSILHSRPGSQETWLLQAQIWLHLAELYLSLDKMTEAEGCVQETSTIFPLSHHVAFMRGRVYEHKHKYEDAKCWYENALSINPAHTKSLQHLGMVLHEQGNNKMAEKALREAVNVDPTAHQSWFRLGLVLESLGEAAAASECHVTALGLESTSPIVPFYVIPHMLQ